MTQPSTILDPTAALRAILDPSDSAGQSASVAATNLWNAIQSQVPCADFAGGSLLSSVIAAATSHCQRWNAAYGAQSTQPPTPLATYKGVFGSCNLILTGVGASTIAFATDATTFASMVAAMTAVGAAAPSVDIATTIAGTITLLQGAWQTGLQQSVNPAFAKYAGSSQQVGDERALAGWTQRALAYTNLVSGE